jgi:hypothetical protein
MRRRPALLLLMLLTATPLLGATDDPGILFELDRTRFEVQVRDLRDERDGPALRVVIGSPSHPTPAGNFAIHQVVRNPRWTPGEIARGRGAQEKPASSDGPLGVAKITFGPEGIALHGGARRLLLGKPISLGCVRALDADMLLLLEWLEEAGALGEQRPGAEGEITQRFQRRARIVVY